MPPENPTLASEFIRRRYESDAMRRTLQARLNTGRNGDDLQEGCDRIDEENMHFLNEVITRQGSTWPGIKLLGADGAKAAAIIAQRNAFDEKLQDFYVQLAETAFAAKDIAPDDYAGLVDIRLLYSDGVQLYGTQARTNKHTGEFEMEATQDSGNLDILDARRKAIGLGPILEHAEQLKEQWRQEKLRGIF